MDPNEGHFWATRHAVLGVGAYVWIVCCVSLGGFTSHTRMMLSGLRQQLSERVIGEAGPVVKKLPA